MFHILLAPDGGVPEADLLRDLLYVFQGIDGHIIRYDASSDHYLIDKKVLHSLVNHCYKYVICRLV